MGDMPDLSHLTDEERRIIEGVMMRQKQEEERESEIMRYVFFSDDLEIWIQSRNLIREVFNLKVWLTVLSETIPNFKKKF